MPRKRKIHRHRRWTPLQLVRLQDRLLCGDWPVFKDDAERRLCWEQNRERLMAAVEPGYRPEGWWLYEAPAERNHAEFEPLQLLRMGVLRPDELDAARHLVEWWSSAPSRDPAEAAKARADVIKLTSG